MTPIAAEKAVLGGAKEGVLLVRGVVPDLDCGTMSV